MAPKCLYPILPECSLLARKSPNLTQTSGKELEELVICVGEDRMDIVIEQFKKLTSLKVSTWWLNPRDYLDHPWVLIIRILRLYLSCYEIQLKINPISNNFFCLTVGAEIVLHWPLRSFIWVMNLNEIPCWP